MALSLRAEHLISIIRAAGKCWMLNYSKPMYCTSTPMYSIRLNSVQSCGFLFLFPSHWAVNKTITAPSLVIQYYITYNPTLKHHKNNITHGTKKPVREMQTQQICIVVQACPISSNAKTLFTVNLEAIFMEKKSMWKSFVLLSFISAADSALYSPRSSECMHTCPVFLQRDKVLQNDSAAQYITNIFVCVFTIIYRASLWSS